MEVQVLIVYYLTEIDFHNLCHLIELFGNLAEMFGNVQIVVVFYCQVFLAKGFSSSNVANNDSNLIRLSLDFSSSLSFLAFSTSSMIRADIRLEIDGVSISSCCAPSDDSACETKLGTGLYVVIDGEGVVKYFLSSKFVSILGGLKI